MLKKRIFYTLILVAAMFMACSEEDKFVTPSQSEEENSTPVAEEEEQEEEETEQEQGVIPDTGDTSSMDRPTFSSDPKPTGKTWVLLENLSDEFNEDGLNTSKWEDGPHSKFP